jgi:hypothetical protein
MNKHLAIEVDGGQHAGLYSQQHDAYRDSYLITPFLSPLILRGEIIGKTKLLRSGGRLIELASYCARIVSPLKDLCLDLK